MTHQSCGASEQVRTAKILRRTAFTCVFSALLMPLGMTAATGQVMFDVQAARQFIGASRDAHGTALPVNIVPQVKCTSPDADRGAAHLQETSAPATP